MKPNENRDADIRRIALERVEEAGPDGCAMLDMYHAVKRKYHKITQRYLLDQIARMIREKQIAGITGGGKNGESLIYFLAHFRDREMSQSQRDRAFIRRFRPMKALFRGYVPGRFDVR